MRILYALGEVHDWFARYAEFEGADALADFMKSDYSKLREDTLQKFLKNGIDIVFCEGLRGAYSKVLSKVGYNGTVIYLDEGFKDIEEARSEAQKIYRNVIDELSELKRSSIDEAKSKGKFTGDDKEKYLEKRNAIARELSHKIADIYSEVDQGKREDYWAQRIDGNLKRKGLLICGSGHFDPATALNGGGNLPSLLKRKGISLNGVAHRLRFSKS